MTRLLPTTPGSENVPAALVSARGDVPCRVTIAPVIGCSVFASRTVPDTCAEAVPHNRHDKETTTQASAQEAASEPVPAEEPATATLGELYQRQGHDDEAERIFRRVLEQEPRQAEVISLPRTS